MAETGHFASLWNKLAQRLESRRRVPARRLASRRPAGRDRGEARRRPAARDQGGLHRPQRNVHRRHEPRRRRARGDRSRAPPGALHGGHDLVACVHRLPARRVESRRHRRRIAKGPDAAAGLVVQRDQREGACRVHDRETAALRTGIGARCSPSIRRAIFPYTPATNLLYGLAAALDMLFEEGLDNVFARHDRLAEADAPRGRTHGASRSCAQIPRCTARR